MMRFKRSSRWFMWIPLSLLVLLSVLLVGSRPSRLPPRATLKLIRTSSFGGMSPEDLDRLLATYGKEPSPASRLETPPGYTASTTGGRLFFAHIGDGDIPSLKRYMQTTIILVNDSEYVAVGTLNFYDDAGSPLEVKIGSTTASSFPVTLKAGQARQLRTSGKGRLKVGWAAFWSDQPVTGTSSFSVKDKAGKVFTDVGVSEAILNTELTLFADSKGAANTGVALINPDPQDALDVLIELLASSGGVVRSHSLQIPPLGHRAQFLTELFSQVKGINEFEGTLRITGNHPFGGTTLRALGSLLTTVPMVPAPSEKLFQRELFFPHIADGVAEGLKITTSVILFNNTDSPVAGTIDLLRSNGSGMRVKIGSETGSSFDFSLAPRSVRRLITGGTGGIKTGWARVTADSHISGAAVFHLFNGAGQAITEVGVNDSSQLTIANIIADSLGAFRTGYAIANPSDEEEVEVQFSLYKMNGVFLGQRSVTLQPNSHQSQFVDELFSSVTGITEMQGRLTLSTQDPVIVLTLLQVGTLTTSAPTLLPARGFTPISVLDFAQTLPGKAPLVRWRLEQKSTDLSLEKLEISAPKLGFDSSVLQPKDEIGYGCYLLSLNGQTTGGVVKAVLSGQGTNNFDLIAAGPAIPLGSILASGRLTGSKTSGLKLTLGPNKLRPLTWNRGIGLELDIVFRDGMIAAPKSAGQTSITTSYLSSSCKEKETEAWISHQTIQKTTFSNVAAGTPKLVSTRPPLLSPGEHLAMKGSSFPSEPRVVFESYDGVPIEVPGSLVKGTIECFVPPGATEGQVLVKNETAASNPLVMESPFSPFLVATRFPENAANQFGLAFQLRKAERQLSVQSWRATLLNTGVSFSGLKRNQDVGDFVKTDASVNTFDLMVDSVSAKRLVMAVGEVDDPEGNVTIDVLGDGNIQVTYSLPESSTAPNVDGVSVQSDLKLEGITFTQASPDNPPVVQASVTSVMSDPTGSGKGFVADQGLTVF